MKDFQLTEDMDLALDDRGNYAEDETGLSALLACIHTDAKYSGNRGYWVDIPASPFWVLEQFRKNGIIEEILEDCRDAVQTLVDDGLFSRIEVIEGEIAGSVIFRCYSTNADYVLERTIAV